MQSGKWTIVDISGEQPGMQPMENPSVEVQPVADSLAYNPEAQPGNDGAPALTELPPMQVESGAKKKRKRPLTFEETLRLVILDCEWAMCSATCKKMEEFLRHIGEHLSEQSKVETSDGYICVWRDCGNACDSISELKRHIYFHAFHTKLKAIGAVVKKAKGIDEFQCILDSNGRNMIPEIPEDFQCMWHSCEETFSSAQDFYWHVERHTFYEAPREDKQFACHWQGCKWVFKFETRLTDHIRSHTQEKRVGCPNCGMIYSANTKFFDHYSRQVPVKLQPYQCSHCSVRFPNVRQLRDHVRRHINHFKCTECDMTCPTRAVLFSHMKYRHNNERPHKCLTCDKSFKSATDLGRHMTVHSEKPAFACPFNTCEYVCRSQSTLDRHIKLSHNSMDKYHYLCHICNAKFALGFFLTKHLKTVHHFHWPSGHSRFRYKQDPDGFYRLQTVRYESMELMNEGDENPQEEEEMVDDPLANPLSVASVDSVSSDSSNRNIAEDSTQESRSAKHGLDTETIFLVPPSLPKFPKNEEIVLPSEY